MSVTFNTNNPGDLLSLFKQAINNGHIRTWCYNKDGYYTHSAEQWKAKAWFLPKTTNGQLHFVIVRSQNQEASTEVYAIFHGRLIEAMFAHFDKNFSTAAATALPTSDDKV